MKNVNSPAGIVAGSVRKHKAKVTLRQPLFLSHLLLASRASPHRPEGG